MKEITKQEAVEDLKKLFDYESQRDSRYVMVFEHPSTNTKFMISKMYMTRDKVVSTLQRYFSDKYIKDGQCRIDNITFVYTIFAIEDRDKQQ